jgi:hypothetical protein
MKPIRLLLLMCGVSAIAFLLIIHSPSSIAQIVPPPGGGGGGGTGPTGPTGPTGTAGALTQQSSNKTLTCSDFTSFNAFQATSNMTYQLPNSCTTGWITVMPGPGATAAFDLATQTVTANGQSTLATLGAGAGTAGYSGYVLTPNPGTANDFVVRTSTIPVGGSNTQLQYNNSGALGGISDTTYDGSHTITLGSAGIWNASGGTLQYGPQAPQFAAESADALCAAAGGTPTCPGTIATAETAFTHTLVLGSNVPAANRAILLWVGMDVASTAGPNETIKLLACAQANFTAGTSPNCSSGGATLWNSATVAPASTSTNANQALYGFFIQGTGVSGNLYVTEFVGNGKVVGPGTTSLPSLRTSVPMNSGSWVIYLTNTWSAGTAGNWASIVQFATMGLF